jgi:hypothetical protein
MKHDRFIFILAVFFQRDSPIPDGEIVSRVFRPATSVEISDFRLLDRHMGMPATDDIGAAFAGVGHGSRFDGFDVPHEYLRFPLGVSGHGVALVDFLKQPVDRIAQPGRQGMLVDEAVEAVSVETQYLSATTFEAEFIDDFNPEQMGNRFEITVVIAVDPDRLHVIRQFADGGKHLPVLLAESSEIEGIEDIAIQNKPVGSQATDAKPFQKFDDLASLAVVATQVKVGQNHGVLHDDLGGMEYPFSDREMMPTNDEEMMQST